jgi:hypothetical protein
VEGSLRPKSPSLVVLITIRKILIEEEAPYQLLRKRQHMKVFGLRLSVNSQKGKSANGFNEYI